MQPDIGLTSYWNMLNSFTSHKVNSRVFTSTVLRIHLHALQAISGEQLHGFVQTS